MLEEDEWEDDESKESRRTLQATLAETGVNITDEVTIDVITLAVFSEL